MLLFISDLRLGGGRAFKEKVKMPRHGSYRLAEATQRGLRLDWAYWWDRDKLDYP
jgi:hypothetical protein